jgi:hypothetical protein
MSETSAPAFGGCESARTDVLTDGDAGTFGRSTDRREFVVCESDGYGIAARVAAGRSSELGHAPRIPYTGSVDTPEFSVYDKAMTTKRIEADNIITGMTVIPPGKTAPVEVIDAFDNGGQREVYCTSHRGHSVFIISRYDDIEMVVSA